MQPGGDDSGRPVAAQHDGAGAVAEQHAGRAVFPVEYARVDLGSHDQHVAVLARADELVCRGEAVDEAAAYRLHVECRAVPRPELGLQDARGAGKHHVRSGGGDDDEVERLRRDPRLCQRGAARLERKVAGGLSVGGDMALPYAGARMDPLVGGVHHDLEVAVGEHLGREVGPGGYDAGIMAHAALFCMVAMRSVMCARTPPRASSSARRTANSKAKASAEPWLFTTIPARPSRLAPL